MIVLMLFIACISFAFSAYCCIVEAICERDWPRKSIGSFALIVFSILCLTAVV